LASGFPGGLSECTKGRRYRLQRHHQSIVAPAELLTKEIGMRYQGTRPQGSRDKNGSKRDGNTTRRPQNKAGSKRRRPRPQRPQAY